MSGSSLKRTSTPYITEAKKALNRSGDSTHLAAQMDGGGVELAAELSEFMRYCCVEKGGNDTTIASTLVVVSVYHQ